MRMPLFTGRLAPQCHPINAGVKATNVAVKALSETDTMLLI